MRENKTDMINITKYGEYTYTFVSYSIIFIQFHYNLLTFTYMHLFCDDFIRVYIYHTYFFRLAVM